MRKPRERCKDRDGHGHWNSIDEQDKHFFKVMIGDFHERMTIPDRFVQHFRRESGRFIKLQCHKDHTFDVEVTRNSEKLVLQSGWKEFVSAHDLKMGDFLVFRYDGNSELKVLIFDQSGCQKALVMKNSTRRGERREESVEISSTCTDRPVRSSQRGSRQTRVQWDSSRQGSKISHPISSSRSITSGSSGSDSPIQFISSSRISTPGYVSPSEDYSEAHFVRSCILPDGTHQALTQEQKKKLKEKVRAIYSGIPIYGCTIKKSSVYGRTRRLNISWKFAEVYLPFEERTVTLQRHGKSWEVRCCVQGGKSKRLRKGWKKFAKDNNLRLGDICLFDLVKNKRKYVMNVHVIPKY